MAALRADGRHGGAAVGALALAAHHAAAAPLRPARADRALPPRRRARRRAPLGEATGADHQGRAVPRQPRRHPPRGVRGDDVAGPRRRPAAAVGGDAAAHRARTGRTRRRAVRRVRPRGGRRRLARAGLPRAAARRHRRGREGPVPRHRPHRRVGHRDDPLADVDLGAHRDRDRLPPARPGARAQRARRDRLRARGTGRRGDRGAARRPRRPCSCRASTGSARASAC